jgi:hypothetical protein
VLHSSGKCGITSGGVIIIASMSGSGEDSDLLPEAAAKDSGKD